MESPNIYGRDIEFSTRDALELQTLNLQNQLITDFQNIFGSSNNSQRLFEWDSSSTGSEVLGLEGYSTFSYVSGVDPFIGPNAYHMLSDILPFNDPVLTLNVKIPVSRTTPGHDIIIMGLINIAHGSISQYPDATLYIERSKGTGPDAPNTLALMAYIRPASGSVIPSIVQVDELIGDEANQVITLTLARNKLKLSLNGTQLLNLTPSGAPAEPYPFNEGSAFMMATASSAQGVTPPIPQDIELKFLSLIEKPIPS